MALAALDTGRIYTQVALGHLYHCEPRLAEG